MMQRRERSKVWGLRKEMTRGKARMALKGLESEA